MDLDTLEYTLFESRLILEGATFREPLFGQITHGRCVICVVSLISVRVSVSVNAGVSVIHIVPKLAFS
jgi:hypothetical protein